MPTRRQRPAATRAVGDATDEELLAATAAGDQAAFAELFERTGDLVYGIVLRVVRDPAQSQEVAQEVLIEAWRIAGRFDPSRGSARTWLVTIAHRRAVDRVRTEQASRERLQRVGIRDQQRPFDEVAEQVEVGQEHDQVDRALAVLSEDQRRVVELAYYEGYTYREVATELDIPLGTVKSRMRDGLVRLRTAIGEGR